MPHERLAFDSTVESLFVREMGPRLSPLLRQRLREGGLDLERPLRPFYPAEQVARWIELCLPEAFPGLSRDEALRALGRRSCLRYTETRVGRALRALLRVLGLRRLLERLQLAMRTGNNYLEARSVVLGPTEVELTFNAVFDQPTYLQGVLEAMAELCGVQEARVEAVACDGVTCTYRVRWRERR